MKTLHIILAIGTMLGWMLLPSLRASALDKKTYLTLPEPMEIPGRVLPAGEYVIKRADNALPNVIRFTDRDETRVLATVHAIPTYRLRPSDRVEIVTEERPAGSPEALKKWFYPGDLTGAEFVYPKSRSLLASTTTPGSWSPVTSSTPPASSEEEPFPAASQESAAEPGEEQAATGTQPEQPVEIAQVQPPPAPGPGTPQAQQPASDPATVPAQEELPQTATSLTLASILGGLAFAGGLALRKLTRRLG